MKHGSLFSGIGGFDLASEWMGWDNEFHCEWEDFPRKILKHYWPEAESYGDIKETDFTIWRNKIDILTGGFPCQPYSAAGKRLGKEDDRHLWPEMLRAIREIKPRWVVGENVRGLVNWSEGLVFEEVCAELEAEGYKVQPFLLPACGVGATHRRDRVWFIAYSNERAERSSRTGREIESNGSKNNDEQGSRRKQTEQHIGCSDVLRDASDTSSQRLQRGKEPRSIKGSREERNKQPPRFIQPAWQKFPTQPPICWGDDGLPTELDGITFSKWRNESIKGYGNAIVPQVVYQIFKSIKEYENLLSINCKKL
jgi:DNA (cytosine-5)-methyltransferase 1